MAQHDYVIANASGATVRADINSALSAIQTLNSGTSEPSSTAAGMLWLDTTGGAPYALKVRDAGNNHWLTLGNVTDPGADGNLELLPGKINLPSSGGVYESDGSTEILTESSGSVTLKNTTIGSSSTINTQDYCSVRVSALQTLSHDTYVPIDFDTDEHDPNNWFDTTTYKFQPTKAGKYFFSLQVTVYADGGVSNNEITLAVTKKNSTSTDSTGVVTSSIIDTRNDGRGYNFSPTVTGFVDMNGSSDYLYNMVYFVDYQGNHNGKLDQSVSQFMAFRVGS